MLTIIAKKKLLSQDKIIEINHSSIKKTGSLHYKDPASPISDATILSSTGASCPHLEHVATQIPYAFFEVHPIYSDHLPCIATTLILQFLVYFIIYLI